MNKPPFNIGDILLGTSPYYKGVVLMITGETNPEDGTTPVKIIFDLDGNEDEWSDRWIFGKEEFEGFKKIG